MANIKIVFKGSEKSKTDEHELTAFANTNNEIYICIDMGDFPSHFICLDKPTAIRLVKELKLNISYLDSYGSK